MTCKYKVQSSLCNNIFVITDCLITLYQEENKDILLSIKTALGEPFDLDTINQMEIILYDTRDYRIARYNYLASQNIDTYTGDTYTGDTYTGSYTTGIESYADNISGDDVLIEFEPSEIWFDNLPITILQLKLNISDTDGYLDSDDAFIDKGNVKITIANEISKYLMLGSLHIDLKLTTLSNETYIITCLNIGSVKKNKFI